MVLYSADILNKTKLFQMAPGLSERDGGPRPACSDGSPPRPIRQDSDDRRRTRQPFPPSPPLLRTRRLLRVLRAGVLPRPASVSVFHLGASYLVDEGGCPV